MNIEDLSKSQLLLLTILVNFVTAIATAVLTVSLLDDAPQTVTQTVNRIVERTIETVTPSTPQTITETVVINNEEFRTEAIAASVARTVSLKVKEDEPALAVGIYLSGAQAIATYLETPPKTVFVSFQDGTTVEAILAGNDAGVVVYRFAAGTTLPQAPEGTFVEQASLKQGQTVISIGADGSAVVGIISKVDQTGVYTSLPSVPPGTGAVNLDGNIIGIGTPTAGLFINDGKVAKILSGNQ
jgi:hypothetical protein